MSEYELFKIDEDTIRRIIAKHYGTIKDGISLHHDYKFVLKHGDKVREDYIYSIVQTTEKCEKLQQMDENRNGEIMTDEERKAIAEKAYQRGLNDAWDATRWLAKSNAGINFKIFGRHFTNEIVQEISASESIEKIRQYEQEQEEIRVGDEVIGIYSSGEQTKPFVITKWISDYYFGIYSDSGEFCQGGLKLQKTGRYFPEIAEALKKMKEETA